MTAPAETTTASPTIRDVITALEAWAPPASAQDYDNVGLQVGQAGRPLERALVALDLTHSVIDEARRREASLIITHHPLLFRPLSSLTPATREGALALRLAESGIALYATHTNLDAAHGGVSFALADRLGLQDVDFMSGFPNALRKLVTFVPRDHFDNVRAALAEAGAGQIGDYEACAFASEGTGYFRPTEGTNPYVGTGDGELEQADEVRLEAEVARWDLAGVLRALRKSHPYEEIAYDVYPLEQEYNRAGLGAVGSLDAPESLPVFLQRVSDRLDAESLRYAGQNEAQIERVAVCGGAGSDFVDQALRTDADAYVTADVKYHDFFEVLDGEGTPEMAFIDAGHYETEALTEKLLVGWLNEQFAGIDWLRTETRTSPMQTFVPG